MPFTFDAVVSLSSGQGYLKTALKKINSKSTAFSLNIEERYVFS